MKNETPHFNCLDCGSEVIAPDNDRISDLATNHRDAHGHDLIITLEDGTKVEWIDD